MPVIVEHADGRVSAHGAMGGRAQPQIHLQLLRHTLTGQTPQQAVSAPRLVVRDGAILVEPGLAEPGPVPTVSRRCCCRASATRSATR